MTRHDDSAPVPGPRDRTRPAEDVRARWAWTEAAVWTDRMLTALETGVKGGRWHSLIDKVHSQANLFRSWVDVARNRGSAGVDHVTVDAFAARIPANLNRLSETLRSGTYRPQEVRRVWIPKPGSKEQRPLGVPTVRDRVVQGAVLNVLEPIFERDFAEHSYGFRPGRGCKDALRRVDQLVKRGHVHVVDADLKGYFDTIPHNRLLERVAEKVSDGQVLSLIESFLKQGVMDGLERWTPESGTPQGAVLSPLLSNVYLDPLDHLLAERGFEMVRYADDFVILCRTAGEAATALALVRDWVETNGLTLHPEKTRIVDARVEGFDFLGYHFRGEHRWPRRKSLARLKATLRAKTKRTDGRSLKAIVADVNPVLRGWYEYFRHSTGWIFTRVDQWMRMRLRSLLRKRRGGRGRGRGLDHHRWPNAYFAKHGLFSLATARASPRQPSPR